jgi:hypothetical protein
MRKTHGVHAKKKSLEKIYRVYLKYFILDQPCPFQLNNNFIDLVKVCVSWLTNRFFGCCMLCL